jgi:hypothetical protein
MGKLTFEYVSHPYVCKGDHTLSLAPTSHSPVTLFTVFSVVKAYCTSTTQSEDRPRGQEGSHKIQKIVPGEWGVGADSKDNTKRILFFRIQIINNQQNSMYFLPQKKVQITNNLIKSLVRVQVFNSILNVHCHSSDYGDELFMNNKHSCGKLSGRRELWAAKDSCAQLRTAGGQLRTTVVVGWEQLKTARDSWHQLQGRKIFGLKKEALTRTGSVH